jgi:nucleotide-binding universal stress UspA family protein
MKNVLVAIDDTKGSKGVLPVFLKLFPCVRPEKVFLLHVQQFGGRSALHYISDTDWLTLKEVIEGTEVKEAMDRKSNEILGAAKKFLEDNGITGVETITKSGYAAEEILSTAKEKSAEMIIIGSRGKRMHTILLGSISREVANNAEVPVLIAR